MSGPGPGGDVRTWRHRVAILDMVDRASAYVPGYRAEQRVQFGETFTADAPLYIPETGKFTGR